MKEILIDYLKYNLWANQRIAEFIEQLSNEQLDLQQQSSFPTIRKTLIHIWDAQIIWLLRLNGVSPDKKPSEYFNRDKNEILTGFVENSQKFLEYIITFKEEELNKEISYKNLSGEIFSQSVYKIVLHCMNHSTFHRGQLITMLRFAGFTELSSTDLINYFRENEK